ncbi:MAG: hypothetical protein IKN26_02815, partial [Eubacterium sp.]|nr:hypothetical protein [Eubacterium sp.]
YFPSSVGSKYSPTPSPEGEGLVGLIDYIWEGLIGLIDYIWEGLIGLKDNIREGFIGLVIIYEHF